MSINIAVVPAAGKGRRFGYLRNILPKTLLPIYGKPILHHIIENLNSVGVKEVCLIVNYKKELIEEYVKNVLKKEFDHIEFNFIYQKELLGIAHAISLTKDFIASSFAFSAVTSIP